MSRILVVEDDRSFQDVVQTILEEMGHEVVVVANGKVALARLLEQPAALMITDIFMPDMEGLETIMQARKLYPAMKVIAMSGGTPRGPELNYLEMAQKFGATRVLAKPFTADQLAEAIKETRLER